MLKTKSSVLGALDMIGLLVHFTEKNNHENTKFEKHESLDLLPIQLFVTLKHLTRPLEPSEPRTLDLDQLFWR